MMLVVAPCRPRHIILSRARSEVERLYWGLWIYQGLYRGYTGVLLGVLLGVMWGLYWGSMRGSVGVISRLS